MAYYVQSPPAYQYAYAPTPLTQTFSAPNVSMPTYYISPSRSHRSRSHSHSHAQPQAYYTYGQAAAPAQPMYAYPANYGTGNAYYRSPGQGNGAYYATPSSTRSHRSHSTSGHRRSHSTSRHHSSPRVVDLRGSPGHSHSHSSGHHGHGHSHSHSSHRRHSSSEPSVGDRVRRFLGMEPSHPAQYIDARTGRTVDWRGRPIYRV
ncbi:hypothetical protein WOLCODRAFT_163100 [Wolfiporia cocos MD-104 SS10]|uniref:Uncharacterized protein n=1 Tax=Wolfiporia cocos (strain MD-104) TaxID=742152 RepID=A0A2H3JZ78_WOLCO|nr:hypothetical protein WOLCODRAFT_163100 [Wolfiporia cocos MD-104 SS10]